MKSATELAGCVVLDDYERILLLHRNTPELIQWELPGGKVEDGEPFEHAAVREFGEELGVRVRTTRLLGSAPFEIEGRPYNYTWFQAVITEGRLHLCEPEKFDDFGYFELEKLTSLALSANMQILLERIMSGEVVLRV